MKIIRRNEITDDSIELIVIGIKKLLITDV